MERGQSRGGRVGEVRLARDGDGEDDRGDSRWETSIGKKARVIEISRVFVRDGTVRQPPEAPNSYADVLTANVIFM